MTTIPQLSAALGDSYRVERDIGAGGMATVFLARDLKHDREVALKVLRPDLAAVLGTGARCRYALALDACATRQYRSLLPHRWMPGVRA